jgi:hypothetical protein
MVETGIPPSAPLSYRGGGSGRPAEPLGGTVSKLLAAHAAGYHGDIASDLYSGCPRNILRAMLGWRCLR